jgi:putative transposase
MARHSPGLETRGWNSTKSAFADYASASTRSGDTAHPEAIVRSYAEIYLHFVWGTWDRHPLLTSDRVETVYRAIHHECAGLRTDVIAIGGMEDHVHLFVRTPVSIAPAVLVKQVKGASSHLVNPEHGSHASFRWQGGYGVFSVSRQHVPRIRNYVLNQEAHHREGRTAAFLEPVYPPYPGPHP